MSILSTMITLQDIEAQRTAKGGFTREGLAKLGIGWPPQKGWLKRLMRNAQAAETKDVEQKAESKRPESIKTVKIVFDGGTPCNIPSKGYGNGYGSYQIDEEPVYRCHFNRPMSANAAEIHTAAHAVRSLEWKIPDAETAAATDIHFLGDSRIALKWCRLYRQDAPKNGSDEFRDAIIKLHQALRRFRSVRADWWPRENSVKIFGH